MRATTSMILAAAMAAFVGCQGDAGGPGKSVPTTNPLQTKRDTFELAKPLVPISLKQGEKKELEIKITRKEAFHQTVKLTFEPDKGIKVDVKGNDEIKDPATNAKGFVEADKDATVGEHFLKVTATPEEGGSPATVEYKVEVKAK